MAKSALKIAAAVLLLATLCAPSILGQEAEECKGSCVKRGVDESVIPECTTACKGCFAACDVVLEECSDVDLDQSSQACTTAASTCEGSCETKHNECLSHCGPDEDSCKDDCGKEEDSCDKDCSDAHASCVCGENRASCVKICLNPVS